METRDFCYWLQGFFELNDQEALTKEQVQKIRNRLDSCFYHEADKINLPEPKSSLPLDGTVRC